MTENEVAQTLTEWLMGMLGPTELDPDKALQVGYPFLPSQKGALPDVSVEVAQKRLSRGAEERLFFPMRDIEQTFLRVFECQVTFMVEVQSTQSMASDEAEQELLREYGARVEASILADASLGGRLGSAFISPVSLFDYRLPFVQYGDGTRGRQATVVLAVGEQVMTEETM